MDRTAVKNDIKKYMEITIKAMTYSSLCRLSNWIGKIYGGRQTTVFTARPNHWPTHIGATSIQFLWGEGGLSSKLCQRSRVDGYVWGMLIHQYRLIQISVPIESPIRIDLIPPLIFCAFLGRYYNKLIKIYNRSLWWSSILASLLCLAPPSTLLIVPMPTGHKAPLS